jgi:Probable cobalt transporter subunit (CbtA)
LVGWSVAVLPFLKYPANPPGVGETETIAYRQGLYFGFLGLSAVGTALAVGIYRWLKRSASFEPAGRMPAALAVAVYAIFVIVAYLVMPANPDPVEIPAELVWPFRVVAFLGLLLFWAVLGGAFIWLLREAPAPASVGKELG